MWFCTCILYMYLYKHLLSALLISWKWQAYIHNLLLELYNINNPKI